MGVIEGSPVGSILAVTVGSSVTAIEGIFDNVGCDVGCGVDVGSAEIVGSVVGIGLTVGCCVESGSVVGLLVLPGGGVGVAAGTNLWTSCGRLAIS